MVVAGDSSAGSIRCKIFIHRSSAGRNLTPNHVVMQFSSLPPSYVHALSTIVNPTKSVCVALLFWCAAMMRHVSVFLFVSA